MRTEIALRSTPHHHRVTYAGVIRSEWLKFRTHAVPQLLMLLTAAAAVIMSVFNAAGQPTTRGYSDDLLPTLAELTIINSVSVAMASVSLPIAVVAVLVTTGDFGQRLAPLTFLAVPRRYPVFFARALLLLLITLAISSVAMLASCLAVSPIISAGGHELRFFAPTVASPLLGLILSLGLFAVLGCCLGMLCRSTIGGIFAVIAIVEIAPMVLTLLETNLGLSVFEQLKWALPSFSTLSGLHAFSHPEFPLPPLGPPLAVGLPVFAAWIAGTGALACLRLQRDV
jgi:ABC-2 type transport system permease protein